MRPARPFPPLLGAVILAAACAPAAAAPVGGYRVVRAYPHDPDAFTQGLVIADGRLFEGTGLNGRSSVREVELETGRVLRRRPLAPEHFGEGLTELGGRLFQLTWTGGVGFVYDRATFEPVRRFSYAGEGWGLTHDGRRLIMSDGTAQLRFLDPGTLAETGRITVTDEGRPVPRLNELEWVEGEVFANVWTTDRIARIDPATGRVTGWIDLSGLLSPADRAGRPVDVLNGIAYDRARKRLFVTGKLWPKLYEITLTKERRR